MVFRPKLYVNRYVRTVDNTLFFYNLAELKVIPAFIFSINKLVKIKECKKVILDFNKAGFAKPHQVTAVTGIVHYFQNKYNVDFEIKADNKFFHRLGIIKPYPVSSQVPNSLNKVWIYHSSEEVNVLITKIIKSIRRGLVCQGEGVLDVCEWAVNEVLDNVIQHSGTKEGFIMGNINSKNNQINLCIFDYGMGIYNSLSQSEEFKPRNEADAITMAVKEGVTRGVGKGYGLAGLVNIVSKNQGGLTILSGKHGLQYKEKDRQVLNFKNIVIFDEDCPSTTVDFFLRTDNLTSVEETVGKNYTSIELENLENEEREIVFKVSEMALGTATRIEGEHVRNELINIFKSTKKKIIIDFSKIAIISSSFADEAVAKLIPYFGFTGFMRIFKISNASTSVNSIIDSTIERMIVDNKKILPK